MRNMTLSMLFSKQKTAYELATRLEFRRVLFRSRLQLQQRLLPDFTLPESASGELDAADRAWYWRMETEATEVDDIRRVEFIVYRNEDRDFPVARLAGFFHATP